MARIRAQANGLSYSIQCQLPDPLKPLLKEMIIGWSTKSLNQHKIYQANSCNPINRLFYRAFKLSCGNSDGMEVTVALMGTNKKLLLPWTWLSLEMMCSTSCREMKTQRSVIDTMRERCKRVRQLNLVPQCDDVWLDTPINSPESTSHQHSMLGHWHC